MSLIRFYRKIDDHRKGQIFEGFNLDLSPEEVTEIHKELSTKSVSDIPPEYRKDVQGLLESSLIFLSDKELNSSLSELLSDI